MSHPNSTLMVTCYETGWKMILVNVLHLVHVKSYTSYVVSSEMKPVVPCNNRSYGVHHLQYGSLKGDVKSTCIIVCRDEVVM